MKKYSTDELPITGPHSPRSLCLITMFHPNEPQMLCLQKWCKSPSKSMSYYYKPFISQCIKFPGWESLMRLGGKNKTKQ